MIRTYCLDNEREWDDGISLLLFAVRESVQESLGFSPFELVFGHSVCGPLKLLKEYWLAKNTESLNLLDYVSKFRDKLKKACEEITKPCFQSRRQGFSVITWPNEQTAGKKSRVIPGNKESRNYDGY